MMMLLLLGFAYSCQVTPSSDQKERDAVEATINAYFEGMIERDLQKLQAAFHPDARLMGYRGKELTITSFSDWAAGTASGQPRDPELYDNGLLEVEIKGYTALAKTELYWPGIYYYDFLTLIKIEDQWKIVHKTWYEEPLD